MADLTNFSIAKVGNAWLIQGDIVDSSSGQLIQHIGGAQGINFINSINALPDAAMQEFVQNNALWILQQLYPAAFQSSLQSKPSG